MKRVIGRRRRRPDGVYTIGSDQSRFPSLSLALALPVLVTSTTTLRGEDLVPLFRTSLPCLASRTEPIRASHPPRPRLPSAAYGGQPRCHCTALCLARATARPVLPFPIYARIPPRVRVSPRAYTFPFGGARRRGCLSLSLSDPVNDFRAARCSQVDNIRFLSSFLPCIFPRTRDAQAGRRRRHGTRRHTLSTLGRYAAGSTPATPGVAMPHPLHPRALLPSETPRNDASACKRYNEGPTRVAVVRAPPIHEQNSGGFKAT